MHVPGHLRAQSRSVSATRLLLVLLFLACLTLPSVTDPAAQEAANPITIGAKPKAPSPPVEMQARRMWQTLPDTRNSCPAEFDFFPEGGIRIFGCHLLAQLSWADLQRLAPMKVFLKGPHSDQKLDLGSRRSFGYYNPQFVSWLEQSFIPASNDAAFRKATQSIYDAYVRRLARTMFVTHEKLVSNSAYLNSEKKALLDAITNQTLSESWYVKWFFFMNPTFLKQPDKDVSGFWRDGGEGGWNGHVVETSVAFWIRRSIDGTEGAFFSALKRLLQVYDPQFAAHPSQGQAPELVRSNASSRY